MSLSLFVLVQGLDSQTANNSISGVVLDNTTKEKVGFASVRLLSAKDSVYVNGATTDANGIFKISASRGRYVLQVSYLGYTDHYMDVSISKSAHLGNIFISEDDKLLDEVVVEAKAIEIQVKGDTIEYNADSYKVQESAVVEDLLKKMPGVEIDENGTIKVNGQEVKKILVDGKEFFSDDPKVASKNLPAKMVDKLQVLDKLSDMAQMTGFDDGSEETVINLTVKKGMKEGAFGNALAGYGSEERYEGNAMVNYMRDNTQVSVLGGINNTNNAGMSDLASAMFSGSGGGPRGLRFGNNNGVTKSINGGFNFATEHSDKLKWGGDVRYGNNDNESISNMQREYLSEENKRKEVADARGNNKNQSIATNFRFEWTPDDWTKVVFTPRIQYNTNDRVTSENSTTKYEQGEPLEHLSNESDQKYNSSGNGYKLNGNLDVSRKLSEKGRVLSLGLRGGYSKSDSDGSDFNHIKYFDAAKNDSIIDYIFSQDDDSYNWRIFASLVEPLGRNNFLEFSYNISNRNSTTDKQSYYNENMPNLDTDPLYTEVDTANTRYVRNDFINQNVSLKFKSQRQLENGHSFNYTLGVGLEPSSSQTDFIEPLKDPVIMPRRNFLSFAPSGQFNYLWDRRHNIRIDYQGTTNEPTTLQLYDGIYSRNGLNTNSGNPSLKPSFTNNVRIRYRKANPEQASFMMLFANFKHTSNDIVSISNINKATGGRDASYTNVNGNMSGDTRFIFNRPFRNRNWSVNSMSYVSYGITNTFIDKRANKAKALNLHQNAGLRFMATEINSPLITNVDLNLRGNIRYTNQNNSISRNQNSMNYGGTFLFTLDFPYDWSVESDVNYSTNSGYASGFSQKEWLWNASIAKQVFKNKAGMLRFKIYDILKERSNITRDYNATMTSDITTNTIPSYFMVHFVYKFQFFKGGAKLDDMGGGGRRYGRGPHRM